MPNFKQHLTISAVASTGMYLAMCHYYDRRPDCGEAFLCVGVGALSGCAPDMLEPALHPNHRALCHSLAFGTGMTKLALSSCSKGNSTWDEFQKILVAVAAVCYIAHLIADGCTAKGLPLLHR